MESNLRNLAEKAQVWNKQVFGNVFFMTKKKRKLMARLARIQRAMETYTTKNLCRLDLELRDELEQALT